VKRRCSEPKKALFPATSLCKALCDGKDVAFAELVSHYSKTFCLVHAASLPLLIARSETLPGNRANNIIEVYTNNLYLQDKKKPCKVAGLLYNNTILIY